MQRIAALFSHSPCQDTKDIEWLAITGANLAGEDKISYADRIQWVYDNEEVILDVAKDPMGNLWWLHKDKKRATTAGMVSRMGKS